MARATIRLLPTVWARMKAPLTAATFAGVGCEAWVGNAPTC